jgi:hypothetical protein
MMGFIGAPLLVASSLATMFGGYGQVSASATLFALPIAAWELSLGVYLIVRGLKHSIPVDVAAASPALAA